MNEALLPPAAQERIARAANGFGIPGLAIAVKTKRGASTFHFGEDAAGSGRAVTEQTWFSVASLAKHVTCCAVLQLAQDGRIDVQRRIDDYLHDLPAHWKQPRVIDLMHHASGLPEHDVDAAPPRRADFIRAFQDRVPVFQPREAWLYTNTNYILLGFLVAQASGMPYAHFVDAMFGRAGAHGAAAATPAWTRAANAAGKGARARDDELATCDTAGDGHASFTSEGALAWVSALLEDRVLQPAARDTMFAPAQFTTGRPAAYACGWFVDELRGAPLRHHAGHYDGWTAMGMLSPSRGSGVIAMANFAPGNTRAVRYLAQLALEEADPGATPLSLQPLHDDDPGLTDLARRVLFRRGKPPERADLAEELLATTASTGGLPPVLDLWTGVEPKAFTLVEDRDHATHRVRRYRTTYADRVEHVDFRTTPQGRVYWAWPV